MRGSIPRRWWGLAARARHGAGGPLAQARVVLALGALASLGGRAAPGERLFEVRAPEGMVTGQVRLQALTRDGDVAFVKWQIEDWSRTTSRPFEVFLDVGPLPHERSVIALALDRDRSPLYRVETLLNAGGRRLTLQFLAPLDGQRVSGPVTALVRAVAPAADSLASVALDVDGRNVPLEGDGDVRSATLHVTGSPSVLTARVKTALGRSTERSILLNGRGLQASLDAHVVEQMVAVVKNGEPVENLRASDFTVRDDRGTCEIREARLVRDGSLAVGIAIDTSQSLLYVQELRNAVAHRFLGTLGPRDTAFLQRFGVTVAHVMDWTTSRQGLEDAVLGLGEDPVPGTVLHAAIVDALYQLRGGDGARALLLVTDGNAFEDDVTEQHALAFARQAGVPIFALALPWMEEMRDVKRHTDAEGKIVEDVKISRVTRPPNRAVLERFTSATGGRTYVVPSAGDLNDVFAKLERDLRTRYLISFVSNAKRTGSFHPVEIRAAHGTVRTAAGFLY
ncbi:MAG TPA: VWA domain-containing protein [Thermoanaerobaculia bacterium]|nr:VWA domain-containing protein [Thermoanaerobaculia bacterium]